MLKSMKMEKSAALLTGKISADSTDAVNGSQRMLLIKKLKTSLKILIILMDV